MKQFVKRHYFIVLDPVSYEGYVFPSHTCYVVSAGFTTRSFLIDRRRYYYLIPDDAPYLRLLRTGINFGFYRIINNRIIRYDTNMIDNIPTDTTIYYYTDNDNYDYLLSQYYLWYQVYDRSSASIVWQHN